MVNAKESLLRIEEFIDVPKFCALRYARRKLSWFVPQEADIQDLISAGREGLVIAAHTYEPRENYPFFFHAWRHCGRLVGREGQRLFFSGFVSRRGEIPRGMESTEETPEEFTDRRERVRLLYTIIGWRLTSLQQKVIVHRLKSKGYKEIGKALGKAHQTIFKAEQAAIKKLRKLVEGL